MPWFVLTPKVSRVIVEADTEEAARFKALSVAMSDAAASEWLRSEAVTCERLPD